MTTEASDLDRYRTRIKQAQSVGMHDYATDMAELVKRIEIAEGYEAIVKASRKAITATYQRLALQTLIEGNSDSDQRDAVLLEAGARMVIMAGNIATEIEMAKL